MTQPTARFNPFPGLRHFEMTEAHLFFGREGQSDKLLTRLRRVRFLAVVGSSGCGKSSLIRAGLMPSLHGGMTVAGSRWRVAIFKPGKDPIGNLASSLAAPDVLGQNTDLLVDADTDEDSRTFIEATLRRSALGLVDAVRSAALPLQENLLVVVDQFEELFRFRASMLQGSAAEDSAGFVKLLLQAVRQNQVPVYVVITMRSDFIGDCAQFRDLPEAVTDGMYLVPRMSRDQRRQAITGPVAVAGGAISQRLVNRLLNEAGDDPDQLPILQHALMRTWDYWEQDHAAAEPLDLRHYEAIGELKGALSLHADEAYDELPDERSRHLAERMFQYLTEKGADNREIRHPATVAAIAQAAEAGQAEIITLIEHFRRPGRSFLMPPANVPLEGDSLIDISHESLIRGWKRLSRWVDQESEWARVYRRLAETALLYRQHHAAPWRNPDLEIALAWRKEAHPNAAWARRYNPDFDAATAFLDKSLAAAAEEERARERQRVLALRKAYLFSGVLLLLLVFATWQALRLQAEKSQVAQMSRQVDEKNIRLSNAYAQLADTNTRLKEDKKDLAAKNEQLTLQDTKLKEAKLKAEEALQEQKRIAEDLRVQNLEARRQALVNNGTLEDADDGVIARATTREIPPYYHEKDLALTQIGDHEGAAREASRALQIDPDYLPALFSRGYENLLLGKAEAGEADMRRYLEAEPNSYSAYLNLAVIQGMQGKYRDAEDSTRQALANFQYTNDYSFDSEVFPDLQYALGSKVIYARDGDLYAAMYYELAILQFLNGGDGFDKALEVADCQVHLKSYCRHAANRMADSGRSMVARSMAPFLVSLNWAWLDYRVRPDDYGALAAYGALWERAAEFHPTYMSWALRYYERFQQERASARHRQQFQRYSEVAKFVQSRLAKLRAENVPDHVDVKEDDPLTLAIQAQEIETLAQANAVSLAPANDLLTQAIRKAETDQRATDVLVDLLIQRAGLRIKARDMAGARADSNRILELAPGTVVAYLFLAQTTSDSDEQIEYYDKVIQASPFNGSANYNLAFLLKKKNPAKALVYADRAMRRYPGYASLHALKAEIFNARSSYTQALTEIQAAIAMRPDQFDYYDIRETAEKGLHETAQTIALNKAASFESAADAFARRGDSADALDAYLRCLDVLKSANKGESTELVQWRSVFVLRKLAAFLNDNANPQSAAVFWEQVRLAGYLNGYTPHVQVEVDQLTDFHRKQAKR